MSSLRGMCRLERDVEMCKVKLDRAQKLISGLGGEKTRWTAAAENLTLRYIKLTGDVLLAAAQIAYLGPFTAGYRCVPSLHLHKDTDVTSSSILCAAFCGTQWRVVCINAFLPPIHRNHCDRLCGTR
jgi:hypothetical protein